MKIDGIVRTLKSWVSLSLSKISQYSKISEKISKSHMMSDIRYFVWNFDSLSSIFRFISQNSSEILRFSQRQISNISLSNQEPSQKSHKNLTKPVTLPHGVAFYQILCVKAEHFEFKFRFLLFQFLQWDLRERNSTF